ncbi:unnamed protein product [Rotaria magnacalcarata]|uniref:Uncharacterized protein n=1 Tax=Rotaria magnacalcarata TaxID=392030 RepID=A0A815MSY4_9BILA|nr:unnamed protein product [Rotaria magnacalcarata]CAF5123725.1 unnamed protein product [Rotaria magnacalcarata]
MDEHSHTKVFKLLANVTPVLIPASNNAITERIRLSDAIAAHHSQIKIVNIHRKYFSPEHGREQLQKLVTNDHGQFLLHRLDEK